MLFTAHALHVAADIAFSVLANAPGAACQLFALVGLIPPMAQRQGCIESLRARLARLAFFSVQVRVLDERSRQQLVGSYVGMIL